MRRSRTVILALAWLAVFGCAGTPGPREAAGGPSAIVLVTVDGLVPGELSVFGGPRATPNLEALAEAGSAWSSAWTAAPMTRPAAATYLTGLAPERHGVRDDVFASPAEGVATVAGLLAERGYRTGAFPDSSFLGFSSGLLADFEVVSDPPQIPIAPSRWLPFNRPAPDVAADCVSWLQALPEGTRYFAWLHFSQPLVERLLEAATRAAPALEAGQVARKAKAKAGEAADPEGVARFDEALGTILGALSARGDLEAALVIVAGTQGDATGGESDPPGAGFSVAERALAVPVVVRWPRGVVSARGAEAPVWGPDVPATILERVGIPLPADAEGSSLLEDVDAGRTIYAWSWAPHDQLGWPELRAARSSGLRLFEGAEASVVDRDAAGPRLREALAARARPSAPSVPLEQIAPLLAARGLRVRATVSDSREQPDATTRRELAARLLAARFFVRSNRPALAIRSFERLLENDPDNRAGLLDLGQLRSLTRGGDEEALRLLARAVELYPTDPEVLHWYAHAVWSESWQQAEPILEAVLPFKRRDGDVLYDLACTRSLAGDVESSERYLRRAIEGGYRFWGHMEIDPDLRQLRESGRLSEVLQEYRR